MVKYLIIHPSRGRAELGAQNAKNWIDKAKYPENIQYYFSLDESDTSLTDYLKTVFALQLDGRCVPQLMINDNHNLVDACNRDLELFDNYDVLILVSDDFDCEQNWDVKLSKEIENLDCKEPFMIKTEDGIQPEILTLPILSRGFIYKYKYIYYPEYHSMFADTDLFEMGIAKSFYVRVSLMFEHKHYSIGKSKEDATYLKENSQESWILGEAIINERRKRKFDS